MKIIILFLIIFQFSSLNSQQETNQLIQSLQAQAQKIISQMPQNYSSIVGEIKTNGFDAYDSCVEADFDLMIAKYNFSSLIANNFKIVTFSESEEFQSFHTSISPNYSSIQEFIGAGVKNSGTIQIAFIQLFAEGTPNPIESLSAAQLEIISQALRATAYSNIEKFLQSPPQRLTNYKKRLQFLQDQNAWDKLMTSEATCHIYNNSACSDFIQDALSKYCTTGSPDEQSACLVKIIPDGNFWQQCTYCICAFLYFDNLAMPISDAECFKKFYPNDTDIYDSQFSGNNKTKNVHSWN